MSAQTERPVTNARVGASTEYNPSTRTRSVASSSGNASSGMPLGGEVAPKPNKRATVGTFWFTEPAKNVGRWVFFWVTEEPEGYRIAKFQQYLQ
jgi:hypothetical protein